MKASWFLSLNGRLSKSDYWIASVILALLALGLWYSRLNQSLQLGLLVPLVYCALCVHAKRCRDAGLNAWYALLVLVPPLNLLWILIIGLAPSRRKPFERGERFRSSAGWQADAKADQNKANHAGKGAGDHAFSREAFEQCPHCGVSLRIRLPARNGKGRCGSCGETFYLEMDPYGHISLSKSDGADRANQRSSPDAERASTDPVSVSDCLSLLGLNSDADAAAVKTAYRRAIRRCHPDKMTGQSEETRRHAEIESRRLNQAYATLKRAGRA